MRVLVSSQTVIRISTSFAQHAALGAIERKAVQRRQRVGGDRRARPLDDIALVIVVRRLDQKQMKKLFRACLRSSHGNS